MDLNLRNQIFQQAIKDYSDGELGASAMGFRRLLEAGSTDPRHISYCGLLVATAEGKFLDGRVLCEAALRDASYNPEMYLNLAKVYTWNGQPHRAAEVLRRGLRIVPQDPALQREIEQVSPRSPPALFFLRRNHPLNQALGRTRARISRRILRRF